MSMSRNVVVWHQILSITHVDFANKTIYGFTELTLIPLNEEINIINLNCKQCKISSVVINGNHEASFDYCDPLIIKSEENRRDLQYFLSNEELASVTVDPDEGNGELIITIPESFKNQIKKNEPFMLALEFILEEPKGGLRFIPTQLLTLNKPDNEMYLCTVDHNSHYWFPCVNSYNEPCTWKIEVVVQEDYQVIASGNLIEVETISSSLFMNSNTIFKKYHFFLQVPTSAPNIGLAIGRFDSTNNETINEISFYFDSKLKDLIKHSTSFLNEVFEYFEETFSITFPYGSYKQVYVVDILDESITFASMSIMNVNLLHPETIIDQAIHTKMILVNTIAQQFFGTFISMQNWHEYWIVSGISQFFTGLYLKKIFGNNEYKHLVYQDLKEVCKFEKEQGNIVLDLNYTLTSAKDVVNKAQLSSRYHLMGVPGFYKAMDKKSHLVMRLIDECLGREVMIQLINKLLTNALTVINLDEFTEKCRNPFSVSIENLSELLATFSSKDIKPIVDNWVCKPGVARFNCNFTFNRKKNTVELEIKQDMVNQRGYRKYVGPITIILQEIDGPFTHNLTIEDNLSSKFDITCHSKGKKNKKKKIPLITGEEVDIDTSHVETDSPILWIRIDPDFKLLREIKFDQPDFHWQNEAKYEKEICAQLDSVEMLKKFPSQQTRTSLVSIIENTECYYRVRIQAAYALAEVSNKMIHSWNGPLPLLSTFKKLFMSATGQVLVNCNNFSDFQLYFLQKNIPVAMGQLRSSHNLCPSEVVKFLLDLIKYNENSKNQFSDCYYRAALIDALSSALSTSIAMIHSDLGPKSASLSQDMKLIIEEIVLRLNLEKLLPSYRFVLTCSCLKAMRKLQKLGLIPENVEIFKEYTDYMTSFESVRLVAFEIIAEFLSVRNDMNLFEYLIDFVKNDQSYLVRHHIIQSLCKYPPFKLNSDESPLNNEILVNKLWNLMNDFCFDNALKSSLAEFYHTLFGFNKPKCLKHAAKQTMTSNFEVKLED